MKSIISNFGTSFLSFFKKLWSFVQKFTITVKDFVSSWWRGIIVCLIVIIFFYYPLGAFLMHNIDRDTNYSLPQTDVENGSKTLESMSYIINREVNEKFWTPNLPFFFPSYVLDDMPNFQLGMFDALKDMSNTYSLFTENKDMEEISKLLSYSGTIWMFSPENTLVPVSSANSKYREAKKKIDELNKQVSEGTIIIYPTKERLDFILKKTELNIVKTIRDLETYIAEESGSLISSKSDDKFYYNQGKLYAYLILLNGVERDFRSVISENNQLENWTRIIKSLERASQIDPFIVRNADLSSSFAPNHLAYLSLYAQKAKSNILNIILETK